ncbi:MAG: IS481 family transposase [Gemmatimonadota bacterium]
MPWRNLSPMEQRLEFLVDLRTGLWSMSELCASYGISRKTGYKWAARFRVEGVAGLADWSRRPRQSPNATAPEVVEALVAARRRHPRWGAKKLLPLLAAEFPERHWPSLSTANRILERQGLLRRRRRRHRHPHPGHSRTVSEAANEVWTADFKGEFRTRDGRYCYPLTIVDDHSRYLLACRALLKPTTAATQATFTRLFRRLGLPQAIRTDNGSPFAGRGLARLSRLAVWWIELGIRPELIAPAHPEQNGRHERLHRTLKEASVIPPAASCRAQQRRFDRFRDEYNHRRPHEALGQVPPASWYEPSPCPWPPSLPPTDYPEQFELRKVAFAGSIKWHSHRVFVSHCLQGKTLGLEELTPGVWNVYFGPQRLGLFFESKRRIEGLENVLHPD